MRGKKFIVLYIVFSSFSYCLLSQVDTNKNDIYADIAQKRLNLENGLFVLPPNPKIIKKNIVFLNTKKSVLNPVKKFETQDSLNQLLQEYRNIYTPFLQNFAPLFSQTRDSINISNFFWKKLNPNQQSLIDIDTLDGTWDKVKIPHFGPPLGNAKTLYHTLFNRIDSVASGKSIYIVFKAVDYKAEVYINNIFVGSHEGAFAKFEFDITAYLKKGKNVLTVKVENDYPMLGHIGEDGIKLDGDKIYASTGLGYNDPILGWHHNPPGMGIYQQVYIEEKSNVFINDIFVRPLKGLDSVEVWVEIINSKNTQEFIALEYSVYGVNCRDTIHQKLSFIPTTIQVPGYGDLSKPTDWEQKKLYMGKGNNYLKLRIAVPNARIWQPQSPWMYQFQAALINTNNKKIIDTYTQDFGVRIFSQDTIASPMGAFYLNNQPIKLRGANTMGSFMQCVKNNNFKQLVDDILFAKIANINYIRMTQFPVQQEVYNYCNKLGMLTQTDLPLFGVLRKNKWIECIKQVEELEKHIRSHPCNILVSYINERFPNAEGNPQRHFSTNSEFERFFLAADQSVLLNNPDRVIKAGDGDYAPPTPGLPDNHIYNGWYNGHGLTLGKMNKGDWMPIKPNWLYGCGEFGSEGLDYYNTMLEYYPKEWLPKNTADESNWTPDKISMSQTFRFHCMWFNKQYTVKNWISESQKHQAWVTRFTTEAFRRNNQLVSFAIHLFIDAWPAGWMKSIMDVNRQAKPAYFEYAHALSPLAIQVRSDRFQFENNDTSSVELWIANDLNKSFNNYRIKGQWFINDKPVSYCDSVLNISAFKGSYIGSINLPNASFVKERSTIKFIIQLLDENNKLVHHTNFEAIIVPKITVGNIVKVFIPDTSSNIFQIVKSVGMENVKLKTVDKLNDAHVAVISNMTNYLSNKSIFNNWVTLGGKLIFMLPPTGIYNFGDNDTTKIFRTTMGQYYFASPNLSNSKMKFFKPNDFWLWHHDTDSLITPILSAMGIGKNWESLLYTGQTGWVGASNLTFAAAEKKYGNGLFLINNLNIEDTYKTNFAAKFFFYNILLKKN